MAAGTPPDQPATSKTVVVLSERIIPVPHLDHIEAAITIDGLLNETAWRGQPLIEKLRVTEPDTLAQPVHGTEFRMFATEEGVYASFKLEQPPDTIVQRFTRRDEYDVARDNVAFTLDTSGEGRYAYWLNLSLGDVQMDGTIKPERQTNSEWDGAWYGATQLTEHGWSAEFYVPWSQMAMPKVDGVRRIGLYIERQVAYLGERWGWPGLPESQPRFLSAFQVTQFQAVDPRQQWSLFPYASATYDRIDEDMKYRTGMDMFWRPSSNFQLTSTLFPDFGSVEADDVVVNLTADETFFPEKRLFFQEGQDIFNTTPRSEAEFGQQLILVNTRRIGARPKPPELPEGVRLPVREAVRPTDLLGAAKATGQVGQFRYGVMAAFEDNSTFRVDDQVYTQSGRDFTALRLLYEDSKGAAYRGLGLISTMVAHPDGNAMVHGLDFHRLSLNGAWSVEGQLLYSDRDASDKGFGGFVDVDYNSSKGITHTLQLTAYDRDLNINDMGFQLRNDTRDVRYAFEWVTSNLTRVRDLNWGTFVRYAENWDGYRTNIGTGTNIGVTLNNLDFLDMDVSYFPYRFDDRNSFGHGTFLIEKKTNIRLSYETDTARKYSFYGKAALLGEDLGGHTMEWVAGLTWRPVDNATLGLKIGHLKRRGWLLYQEAQNFTTFNASQWRPELSFDFFPSARQQFSLVFQWVGIRALEDRFYTLNEGTTELLEVTKPPGASDDFSISQLNFQVRYRWQIAPLSDLFVVYTKSDSERTGLRAFDDLFEQSWRQPLGDQLVVKLRYRFGS